MSTSVKPELNAVIMAGGVGSRLWPVSRIQSPKQFHDLLGIGRTLLQSTYDRFHGLVENDRIWVVTNKIYYDLVRAQLPEIPEKNILCEPNSRNTAPCIAYATAKIWKHNPKGLMIVTPSDHLILEEDAFMKDLKLAIKTASENKIVTIGVKPLRPETGYGYIQFIKDNTKSKVLRIKSFTEKPTAEVAKTLLKSGEFVWNTGIFVAQASALWSAYEEHLYDIFDLFEDTLPYLDTPEEYQRIEQIYPNCKNISIDHGLFEKSTVNYVIRSKFGWSDLGTWGAIYNYWDKDYLQNVISSDYIYVDKGERNFIHVPKNKMAVIKGVKDLIIIDTEDVLLICPKKEEQAIREIVNDLKRSSDKNEPYL